MRGDKLSESGKVRMLVVGYPGAGKTGGLASLVNAGFKVRMLDFDGNYQPLLMYAKPELRKNIDIVVLEDKMRQGPRYAEPVGIPEAFAQAHKLLDRWKYKDGDEEVDLGRSKDWGPDTIVVLDSLTSLGRAAFRRAMVMQNKTPGNITDQVWGLAMQEQENFIEALTSADNNHHVIVLSHLVLVGPPQHRKGDDDQTKELKERLTDLVPTRLYPSALGQKLPPKIAEHFTTTVLIESEVRGKSVRRVIRAQPRPELDLKAAVLESIEGLSIEDDGLLKVFLALGAQPPVGGKVVQPSKED
jgi:hypothetical protein